jgi:hypothetical protein
MLQTKIDVKAATSAARTYAKDLLDWTTPRIEEVERESYNGHDAWAITLSNSNEPILGFHLSSPYKRFFVDAETGEVLGVVIRETADR